MTSNDEATSTVVETNRVRHMHLAGIVGWFVSFGFLALAGAWMAYFLAFRGHEIVADPAAWGQLGDFMGGVLNPVLSFLTLFILAFTIILQSRQLAATTEGLELSRKELALSRQELVATREELAKSARAQEQAEVALRAQAEHAAESARLASMNALYVHYQRELTELKKVNHAVGTAKADRLTLVRRRIKRLNAEFDQLFGEFVDE